MKPYIQLLRPLQWIKNTFVFFPLIFSQHLFEPNYFFKSVLAFIAFCLASSSIYCINDIVDKESDKQHPEKKKRPIASGEISVSSAVSIAMVFIVIVLIIALQLTNEFLIAIFLYIAFQFAYSFKFKHIVIVDIFIIALGFMLRVFSGAFAIHVQISHWIIITTLFLSLFLAASKRQGEFLLMKKLRIETKRKVLEDYSIGFLDMILMITATGTAISYALYTMADRTIKIFGSDNLIFTSVFVLFGIFRYLFLVLSKEEGENPALVLFHDKAMSINLLLWLFSCIAIIYYF